MFFLCVDKPPGYTSHDIVSFASSFDRDQENRSHRNIGSIRDRRIARLLKTPPKLIGHIPVYAKHYQCVLKLGSVQKLLTVQDSGGQSKRTFGGSRIDCTMFTTIYRASYSNTPKTSAIKVNGKRLYEYARQGLDVEIPSRWVEIHQLATLGDVSETSVSESDVGIDVHCSKGTYIRSLACDLAENDWYGRTFVCTAKVIQ